MSTVLDCSKQLPGSRAVQSAHGKKIQNDDHRRKARGRDVFLTRENLTTVCSAVPGFPLLVRLRFSEISLSDDTQVNLYADGSVRAEI